ncbi:NAD(P)/FAD-dependent oxidoreductase [Steroidobacter cummioxidans]|uniref:NAD(P)/FAD-dependent oxidoreductase n=1 Tax=Steroidobacter cummioxidans TaxID=1803913 RepID=UPI000E312040|nr:NAD(P)/FAD-dependent oxidoreductase [Steroidobacter cummioxidans]
MHYDAIVVGGSYAGMAAALQLARARRKVLVVDGGRRRNRFAVHSRGFLTQDGTPAAAIAAVAKDQLLAYDTVRWLDGHVTTAQRTDSGFHVQISGAESQAARRLVLASGVVDHLPDLPGLAQRWGRRVFHCPYCHGYELNQGNIGVLATSPMSMHLALLLPDWGSTTLFLNGAFTPDKEQLEQLAARGVALEDGLIERIDGELDLVMKDGRVVSLEGLFAMPRIDVGPIADQLGCDVEITPLGRTLKTDPMKATTVPGVYACGDAARPGGSVALAVGDGTLAGSATHRSLIFESF